MNFAEDVHTRTKKLWQQSFQHPFIKEMASGKLPIEKFKFYCIQDYKYLEVFNQLQHEAMQRLVKKYQIPNDLFSTDDSKVELIERDKYFKEMGVSLDEYQKTPLAPNNYDYLNHMRMSVMKAPEIGFASLLPCPWLYCEMARYWQGHQSTVDIYNDFFNTYEEIAKTGEIKPMVNALNEIAENTSEKVRKEMFTAFIRSSFYELHFWQMAYEEQNWEK